MHACECFERFGFVRWGTVFLATLCTLMFVSSSGARTFVAPGGSMNIGDGVFDLCCTELRVSGTLNLANGKIINARSVSIDPGGVINAGAGQIEIGGSWSNAGLFNAGSSTVSFVDIPCSDPARAIVGQNNFFNLAIQSTTGQATRFGAGQTQSVAGNLTFIGTPSQPLSLLSTVPDNPWMISLASPNGTQNISEVAVSDSVATGQWLAPFQVNRIAGVTSGWFQQPDLPVPSTSTIAILLLILLIAIISRQWVSRRPDSLK